MKIEIIAVIVAIVAILIAGYSIAIEHEGPGGPEGPSGMIGEIGPQGPVGEQGPPGINGTDGTDGSRGPRGYTGPKGDPGEDCVPNEPPTIDLNSIGGSVISYHSRVFWFNISLNDTDDTNLSIDVYHRFYTGASPWNGPTHYSCKPGDDLYVTKGFTGTTHKHIYWLVEVWDGSDLSIEEFEYMIPC